MFIWTRTYALEVVVLLGDGPEVRKAAESHDGLEGGKACQADHYLSGKRTLDGKGRSQIG